MLANWVKETTTTFGTGPLTLSAIAGFPRFSEAFAVSELCSYAILTSNASPQPLEWGIGTIGAGNSLSRSVVLGTYAANTLNTTNPTAVNLVSGTYNVICTAAMGGSVPGLLGVDSTNGSSGAFAPYPWTLAASPSSLAVTADRLYLSNFRMGTPRRLSAVKMRVSTGGVGSCRLGIYKANIDGTPGSLLYASDDITVPASGVMTWTLASAKIVPPGWYFMAFATKGVAPTFNLFGTSPFVAETLVGSDGTAVTPVTFKYATLTSGWLVLPDPCLSTQTAAVTPPPAFTLVVS